MRQWRRGLHVRSVRELDDWTPPPIARQSDDVTLPRWAEYLLVAIVSLAVLGEVAFGLLHGGAQ